MTSRDRLVITVVVTLAAIAAAWLLVIQPKRDEASKLSGQVSAAQQQLATAQTQIATARADQSSYSSNYKAVALLGQAVPSDDNVPSLIYQLQNAAGKSGVDFRILKLTTTGATAAPAPAAAPPSTPGSTSTPAAATSATSAAATQAASATLPPGAAVGPAGFPTMPFTFTFEGNFFHLADFFNRLEQFVVATNKHVSISGRLMTLNAINLGPAQQGFPHITATISATTYLVPASQGVLNGGTPSGPGGSGTLPASGSSSSVPVAPATVTPPTP